MTADPAADPRADFRRSMYVLLICLGVGVMLGRILAVDSIDKVGLEDYRLKKIPGDLQQKRREFESRGLSGEALQKELARIENQWRLQAPLRRPFLSANDRSRWCTVRALVEDDMRIPGAPYAIDRVIEQPNWDTIDMVKHKHDGRLYSSKPPLMPTLMAAVYWPIYRCWGITLETHPYEIGRGMLVLFNVVPMAIYFLLLARLIERFGTTDWGRMFTMAAAVFGTFLTTFAVTINNHLPAAVCAVAAVYLAVRIWFDGERRLRYFAGAGLFGALTVANELPAMSFLALLTLVVLWKSPRLTLFGFVPAVVLAGAAFFGTNWIAHGTLKPAYMHRSGDESWYDYTYQRNGRTIESYWNKPVGVDRGEPSPCVYALNVLVGHHGIFSLTPIWLLSAAGMVLWLTRKDDPRLRWLAAGIAAMSLVCLVFYLGQPLINRNYGGVTSGLRWMFWFAPFWLLTMLPAADGMASRRWTRGLALAMLIFSTVSVSYPIWNPWTHPWLMNFVQYLGWGA